MKQLLTDDIIDSSKQTQSNPFLFWFQSWFGGESSNEASTYDCSQCSCGKMNPRRVFGGIDTGVNQYPWMAIILYQNDYKCGATLINDRYVLTTANCFHDYIEFSEENIIKNITVRLLEHDRSTDNETILIDRKVNKIIKHFLYSHDTLNNDIALVKFTEPVKLVGILSPACLPTPKLSYEGYNGVTIGWSSVENR